MLLRLLVPATTQAQPAVPTQDRLGAVDRFFESLHLFPLGQTFFWGAVVLAAAWLAGILAKGVLLRSLSILVATTKFTWDDALQKRRVFRRLAQIAPAVVIYFGVLLVPGVLPGITEVVQAIALSFMILIVANSANAVLSTINDIYSTRPDAKSRPIKGYLQIIAIVLYVASGILIVSTLLQKDPAIFLGGLAGLTAVVLLVFRDTILSLVASIQLTQNDMIAVGDWVEMEKFGADGDVVDIALHTVKVQNWDKTITTIPTHKLIEDSFKNWRGMTRSGGRRIKRSIYLDLGTIRFLTPEEIQRLGSYEILKDYVETRLAEIDAHNRERAAAVGSDEGIITNARRLTNIGTFRAYIVGYLRNHPLVHSEMTLLVRQLQSGPNGLPMEIYVFSKDTDWVNYEAFQADIFDHLLAMVPEFGLRVFQSPSGKDVRGLAQRRSVRSE
jgi:miniconductance mechanosensitive channel